MGKPGEKRRFDRLPLVRRERRQRCAQSLALPRSSSTSLGSAAISACGCSAPPLLRFFRLSKRKRSIARERAWFMIQPSTVPFAASYSEARRHTSWKTSRVSSSAVSRLAVIRMIKVKKGR